MRVNTGVRMGLLALALGVAVVAFTAVSSKPSEIPKHAVNPLTLTQIAPEPVTADFIEVMEGCDSSYTGDCVVAHTGPSDESAVALKLRIGMVLRTASTTVKDDAGNLWREIIFDEWVRYPGRIGNHLYVKDSLVRSFIAPPLEEYEEGVTATTTKRILIDRSEQKLYAYVGEQLVFWYPVSTGLSLTPTPRGEFIVYRKMPSRYMQGPLPGISSQYYDLPGVPWDLYFTKEGGTIHGAYWHNSFGKVWSHGCVNLSPEASRAVYNWAPVGTPVTVQE